MRLVGREKIGAEVSRSLDGDDSDPVALTCELLRAVLWACTRGGPVHINRLLNLSVDVAHASSTDTEEEALRAQLRRTLDALAEVGDVLELDRGHWSPTSPRIVDLGTESAERLLIGGVPTSALPEPLRREVAHRGTLRFVRGTELERTLTVDVTPLAEWIGAPQLSLRDWGRALLATPLAPYAEPSEGAPMEIYAPAAPAAKRSRNQSTRWSDVVGVADGRYLARRRRVYGGAEYRIVDVRDGVVVASCNALMPGEGRRLMYACDALAGRQVDATLRAEDDVLSLTLWSEVPSPERRFLTIAGTVSGPERAYYPRTWRFQRRWKDQVRRHLEALEIRVIDAEAEGRRA